MEGIKLAVDFSVYEQGRKRPEYTINSDLKGEVSLKDFLEFTRANLIIIADTVLREEQAQGFDKDPVVAVDGRVGKSVADVNPLGSIEFTSRANMKDIVMETYQAIQYRSPVLEGRYKSSNFVFLNGTQVATDSATLESWINGNPSFQDKDLIRFVNIQPYARKLERLGVTGQRQKSRTVKTKNRKSGETRIRTLQPNGAYYLTARSIRAKYKRNSTIIFTFISGTALGIDGSFKQTKRGKPGRPYVYPCILISVAESGVL